MQKKYLILGNMGYVGPLLTSTLREKYPASKLIGYDLGIFSHCLFNKEPIPEVQLNEQHFGDVRTVNAELLKGCHGVVYLAAISNDPMGNAFEKLTDEVNRKACLAWAFAAKKAGVKSFVFASSCSVYGFAGDEKKCESDELNPLTAYARSKIACEEELEKLVDSNFIVTSLRFATACGYSPRLRLDLVINDFVAGAWVNQVIRILSDGTPWRPLIHVADMARAMDWALHRSAGKGREFLAVNTGSEEWNYQVLDLAKGVQEVLPDTKVEIDPNASKDSRTYQVDFSLFAELAPEYQPLYTLRSCIEELAQEMKNNQFAISDFHQSEFIRLIVLKKYLENNNAA
jgi:nucleoside-diphosphate-sugar epimerase